MLTDSFIFFHFAIDHARRKFFNGTETPTILAASSIVPTTGARVYISHFHQNRICRRKEAVPPSPFVRDASFPSPIVAHSFPSS